MGIRFSLAAIAVVPMLLIGAPVLGSAGLALSKEKGADGPAETFSGALRVPEVRRLSTGRPVVDHSDLEDLRRARARIDFERLRFSVLQRIHEERDVSLSVAEYFDEVLEAAWAGDQEAAFLAAFYLLHGVGELPQDLERGVDLLQQAVSLGSAPAMLEMGWIHSEGRGVEQDYAVANEWFVFALDTPVQAEAHFFGLSHMAGWGVERDTAAGLRFYLAAAEAGHADAQFALARHLVRMAETRVEALRWLKAAAAQGHAQANRFLGRFQMFVAKDYPAALAAFRQAVEAGNRSAGLDMVFAELDGFGAGLAPDPERTAFIKSIAEIDPGMVGVRAAGYFVVVEKDEAAALRLLEATAGVHAPAARLALHRIRVEGVSLLEAVREADRLSEMDAWRELMRVQNPDLVNPGDDAGDHVPPRPLETTEIEYPRSMLDAGRGGEVFIQFEVLANGIVSNISVLSATHPAFAEAVVEAVSQWRYSPGLRNGEPVMMLFNLHIPFRPRV